MMYGKSPLMMIVENLVKADMLKALAEHSHALWYGFHDESKCKWCKRYKRD